MAVTLSATTGLGTPASPSTWSSRSRPGGEPGRAAVGVKPMSRLISRLQHRQFGVMVTTSYVHPQAYQEVVEDGHPVMIMAARDIVDVLTRNNYSDSRSVEAWLRSVG